MDTSAIQCIFRHRHILVTKVPSAGTVRFDREGLQMLADVEELVTIQRSVPHLPRVGSFSIY